MQGVHKFQVSTKDILFDIVLRRNVTVIRGNGATYKTLFCKMIAAAHLTGTGAHLRSYPDEVYYITEQEFYADHLEQYTNRNCILVFDESAPCIHTTAFREAIERTGCYFMLITRSNCSCFSISSKEIYEFVYNDNTDPNKRVVSLQQLYPEDCYGSFKNQNVIITEDSNSGKQFFSRCYDAKQIISAHGKSNIVTMLQKNPGSIIIADGAAIGFDMEDIIHTLSVTADYLILKESFEYVLLKSGILDFYLPKAINLDDPIVDSSKYLTWERYYTDLLEMVSAGTPYAYKKESLPAIYNRPANAKAILAVYALPYSCEVSADYTNVFSEDCRD